MTPPLPATNDPDALLDQLREHHALCQEMLGIVSRENEALRGPDDFSAFPFHQQRKNLLASLDRSLNALRTHRVAWQRLSLDERARYPEVSALIRSNQDLIMKIVVFDRENEQALLRRGLVPPRHLPPAARQRPHYVADLYRRHTAA
ncbi:MAG: hypothetical protein HZA90_14935 [Verrucomicrobia bacterium]|nr:hypothetical protein [Verrucomicrobiota bacterium]